MTLQSNPEARPGNPQGNDPTGEVRIQPTRASTLPRTLPIALLRLALLLHLLVAAAAIIPWALTTADQATARTDTPPPTISIQPRTLIDPPAEKQPIRTPQIPTTPTETPQTANVTHFPPPTAQIPTTPTETPQTAILPHSLPPTATTTTTLPPWPSQPHPDHDPCHHPNITTQCNTLETAARHRLETAFHPNDHERAWWIAGCESGFTYHPWTENRKQFRRDTGLYWNPDNARHPDNIPRQGHRVYGIFQHRYAYWEERTTRAYPDNLPLDPFNPWHNTLMAAWVAYNLGWSHYECDKLR